MMVRKNIFSILIGLAILFLSLASSKTFDKVPLNNIPNFDKFVHFAMYFGLMSAIIFENRKSIKRNPRWLLMSIIPLAYGIFIEFLQAFLTDTRGASIWDVLADIAGIYISVLIGYFFLRKIRSDAY